MVALTWPFGPIMLILTPHEPAGGLRPTEKPDLLTIIHRGHIRHHFSDRAGNWSGEMRE